MITQSIETPFGINVFGSAVIRVNPDVASIKFRVSCVDKVPKNAFTHVRDTVTEVRAYLAKTNIRELASSRLTIAEEFGYVNNKHQFVGYAASADFHLLVDELDSIEDIINGLVDSGVTNIRSVEFHTRKLKEIRAEARKRAVAAAREKAELYCEAAEVRLGSVRHIEDVDPDMLRQNLGHHQTVEMEADYEEEMRAFDPGSISVQAAVMLSFGID